MKAIKTVSIFDLFILLIACVSYVSILLLVFNTFNALYALLLGPALAYPLLKLLNLNLSFRITKLPYALIGILLIALFFRFQPYLYVPGGQDQGVYVNMSAVYDKTGSTFVTDHVRNKAIESDLKEWYDSANQRSIRIIKKERYEGYHLPGIYLADLTKSLYVFQFYPLHPLWMAIAGKVVGNENRVYSLVFFSLLSIVAFYFLALELSGGNRLSALIVSLLLALNPLHSFFSKFPVTEVVSLSFSSLSFLYLAKYYRHARAGQCYSFYLVLSAMLMGCMFFTHIRGFLYVPFFYFLMIVSLLFEQDDRARKHLVYYFTSVLTLYAVSVLYGLTFSFPYSHDIYNLSFSRFFSSAWHSKLTATILFAIFLLLLIVIFRKQVSHLRKTNLCAFIIEHGNLMCSMAFALVMIMAIYKAYVFSFTDHDVGGRWNLGGQGWASLLSSNLIVAMWYLSPIGLGLLFHYVYRVFPRKNSVELNILVVFLCLAWYFAAVMKYMTPFQYYYTRYLLNDLVPYSLLAISLTLGFLFKEGKLKRIVSLSLTAIIAVNFLYFAAYQFIGKSADGSHSSFQLIEDALNENDLLFLYDLREPHTIVAQTSLSYFYNINVCNLRDPSILDSARGRTFLAKFGDVFLLSQDPLQVPFLRPVRRIQYRQGEFVDSNFIPTTFNYKEGELNLYRVLKP